jgi:hypothetical protein
MMAHLITFQTDKFDPRAERENPINPIAGEAVLNWLRERLAPNFVLSNPEAEDWGWCSSVKCGDVVYVVGASADLDQEPPIEWAVQIHKRRGLIDNIMGRNRHQPDDPLTVAIRSAIEAERDFQNVTVDTASN